MLCMCHLLPWHLLLAFHFSNNIPHPFRKIPSKFTLPSKWVSFISGMCKFQPKMLFIFLLHGSFLFPEQPYEMLTHHCFNKVTSITEGHPSHACCLGDGCSRPRLQPSTTLSYTLDPIMVHAPGHAPILHPSHPGGLAWSSAQCQQHSSIGSPQLLVHPERP